MSFHYLVTWLLARPQRIIEEAREMIKEYRRNEPDQTVAGVRKLKYKHRPYIEKWAEDLLKAGLPEWPLRVKA